MPGVPNQFLVLRTHRVQVEPVGRLHLEECCVDVLAIHNKPPDTFEDSEAIIIHAISREGNIYSTHVHNNAYKITLSVSRQQAPTDLRMKMAPRRHGENVNIYPNVLKNQELNEAIIYKVFMQAEVRNPKWKWTFVVDLQIKGRGIDGCLHVALAVFVLLSVGTLHFLNL